MPIIVILTKFDSLVTTAFNELREKQKLTIKDAKNKKIERAIEKAETNFIRPLEAIMSESQLSDYVRLDGKLAGMFVLQVHML